MFRSRKLFPSSSTSTRMANLLVVLPVLVVHVLVVATNLLWSSVFIMNIPCCISMAIPKNNIENHALSKMSPTSMSRRSYLFTSATTATSSIVAVAAAAATAYQAANALDLPPLQSSSTSLGLQWADARIGTGNPLKVGETATIDYVLSTTGARYGTKIFGTAEKDMPYRWTLGDGSTIAGIEKAILGENSSGGIPPMLPGGIRRVIIPQSLGYTALAENPNVNCVQDGKPGPIPPPNNGAFEEYQRFKNIYCNPSRQYQPDIVMDIKLYGARSSR